MGSGDTNITCWKAGGLFGSDKIFGQIVKCSSWKADQILTEAVTLGKSGRRKTQNVGIGWLFLAVFNKVLEERNVLVSLLKLVACRDGGKIPSC